MDIQGHILLSSGISKSLAQVYMDLLKKKCNVEVLSLTKSKYDKNDMFLSSSGWIVIYIWSWVYVCLSIKRVQHWLIDNTQSAHRLPSENPWEKISVTGYEKLGWLSLCLDQVSLVWVLSILDWSHRCERACSLVVTRVSIAHEVLGSTLRGSEYSGI